MGMPFHISEHRCVTEVWCHLQPDIIEHTTTSQPWRVGRLAGPAGCS